MVNRGGDVRGIVNTSVVVQFVGDDVDNEINGNSSSSATTINSYNPRDSLSLVANSPVLLSSMFPEDPKVRTNNVSAFVTLLKALFGVSLLSSPRVLGETGLLLGTVVYSLILMACVGSCWCLLQARAKVASDQEEANAYDYHPSSSNDNPIRSGNRPRLLRSMSNGTAESSAITYGDLGKTLLGPQQSTLINFLIVSLHICFGAGLVATSMHQIAIVVGWEDDYNNYDSSGSSHANDSDWNIDDDSHEDEEVFLWGRIILAAIFFPLISIILQFRNIKDLFWVCVAGLAVFMVGCIGSMLYPTSLVDNTGDGHVLWNVPEDAFAWKWSGIPNFVASTLCAMEGINLALPIANHYLAHASIAHNRANGDRLQSSPIPVVTAAVSFFGVFSLVVAYFGYLSGLGGGGGSSSTRRGEEGDDQDDGADDDFVIIECAAVHHCLESEWLVIIHRLSLACSLILTLPIIVYPSLELLERWAEERYKQLKTGKSSSNRELEKESWSGYVWGSSSEELRRKLEVEEALFGREPYFPCLHRHWRYRLSHAAAVCLLAIVDRQWERWLVLYKGTGLSIACFLLPVILFVRAHKLPVVLQQPVLMAALFGLILLGLVNFMLVVLSVFTVHNFLPTEIHDGPMHHHHHSGDE